jgi:hypothetical protein
VSLHLANIVADHTGAVVAGVTSTLGAAAFAAGQVPIPLGVPPELVWASLTFGPPAVWFGIAVLKATASYAVTRRRRSQDRARLLIEAGHAVDDDEVERHLDAADRWASIGSALGRGVEEVEAAKGKRAS